MNRIEAQMELLQEKNEKAFITYITAGLPDLERTKEIIRAQERAGTDVIELGIPFSDPIADGPVIQQASFEAIQSGTTLRKVFSLMEEIRSEGIRIPIVFMLYYNTVCRCGVEEFVRKCNETGVDGLIIPDLPFEEQEEIRIALEKSDQTILIQLVSPVSADRIPMIVEHARGFVYCVSSMGVTGQSGDFHREVVQYLRTVKQSAKIPVMMGFGIREAADVEPMAEYIDGAIVGSYFINLLREKNFAPEAAEEYCSRFKRELNHKDA